MTEKEILEGNTLIAVFMGAELEEKTFGKGHLCARWKVPLKVPYLDYEAVQDGDAFISNELWYDSVGSLQFHSSFDWLIPVEKKIYTDGDRDKMDELTRRFDHWEIEKLWNAIVNYIKWHNQQSQNKSIPL